MFPTHAKTFMKWHEMGPGGFFPTNPDLADILGDTDFDFENLYFLEESPGPFFQIPAKNGAWKMPTPWAGWAPRLGRVGPSGGSGGLGRVRGGVGGALGRVGGPLGWALRVGYASEANCSIPSLSYE